MIGMFYLDLSIGTFACASSRFLRVNDNNECTEIGDKKAMSHVKYTLLNYTEHYAEIPETIIGTCDKVDITEHDILVRKKATDGNTSKMDYSRHVESYSRILKENLNFFTETKKNKKTEFVFSIVRSLRDAGSRFLRVNNNNEYFEIGDKKAVVKVTDAFVNANKNNECTKAV